MSLLSTPPQASLSPSPGLGEPDDWVDVHGDSLLRFAMSRVSDASIAEDLVQETLLAAWRNRESFDGRCTPRTWLISIMKRRVADHFRRCGRSLPSQGGSDCLEAEAQSAPAADGSAADPVESAEFWSVLTACTSDLPEHLARAFRRRAFGEDAPETICESEGISRKNLSVRLCRARTLLRDCLQKRWFGPEDEEPRR